MLEFGSAWYFAQHRAECLSMPRLNEQARQAGGSNSIRPAIQDRRSFSIALHRGGSIRLQELPSYHQYFIVAISYLVNTAHI
jgi:hypothetical protein